MGGMAAACVARMCGSSSPISSKSLLSTTEPAQSALVHAFTAPPPQRSAGPGWQWHRDRLRRLVDHQGMGDVSREELEAHFGGMPPRYWARVTENELVWALQTIHRFLKRLATTQGGEGVATMDARHFSQQGCTKLLVCTWDRVGLLTKLSGYLSALRLNVIRAEVYTRADDIALDVFWLCTADQQHITDSERLHQLAFLLEGGLSEPPRFVSTWACHSHKYAPRRSSIRPIIGFNNMESSEATIITVEAAERLGLLHDIVEALSAHGLNITEALIDTVGETARDIFFVTDENNQKVNDPGRLAAIERAIVRGIGQ